MNTDSYGRTCTEHILAFSMIISKIMFVRKNDFSTGRLLRDAKLYEIGAGTSEIRRMLIGREIFFETK